MTLEFKYPFIDGCDNLPNDKEEDVKRLKDWMNTQPHLPQVSDEYLHLFLHSNYYNLKETQETIETFFTMRANCSELFTGRSPSEPAFQTVVSQTDFAILKESTPDGYKVIVARTHDSDVARFNMTNCLRCFLEIIEVSISENKLCPGYIFIFDTIGMTYSHFLRFSLHLNNIRKYMAYLQEALPIRLKGFYTVNAPSFMDRIWMLFSPFLKSSLRDVIQVHGSDMSGLYKSVPKDIIPIEYGGNNGSMKNHHEETMKLVHGKYERWLVDESAPAADMSKHPKLKKKSYFPFWS